MITGVVLGILGVLLAVTLYQRVWIKVVWGPEDRSIHVRYLLLRFRGPKKHRERKKKKRRTTDGLQWVRVAPQLLRVVGKGLSFLMRHSQMHHLRIEGAIGIEDPASTGILWGSMQAVYGMLRPWSSRLELAIAPDFTEERVYLTLDAEASVRMGTLLTTIVVILRYMPKRRLWRLLREQRHSSKKRALHHARPKEARIV